MNKHTAPPDEEVEAVVPTGPSDDPSGDVNDSKIPQLSIFHRFLTIWIVFAIVIGVLLGRYIPAIPEALDHATIAQVSVPIAVLLWGMILPMMVQIDFASVVNVLRNPKPVLLTSAINYAVQPFTMYAFSVLFFRVAFRRSMDEEKANSYLIGTVLLGGAPCTAMVFIWSRLMNGSPAYTLTQVAINNIILLVVYSPTVKLLAGTANVSMPWNTLFLSVGFFLVVPLLVAIALRAVLRASMGLARGEQILSLRILPLLDRLSMFFLVLTVALIFVSQAPTITSNYVDMLVIAVPLVIQTIFIWGLTFAISLWVLRLPYAVAGPATLIACSNFFEMAVAVAVAVYGSRSSEALATVVGVLIEVPIMLLLVWINNWASSLFQSPVQASDDAFLRS